VNRETLQVPAELQKKTEGYQPSESLLAEGTKHFSDAEHARYDDEETRFKTAHGSCGSPSPQRPRVAGYALWQVLPDATAAAPPRHRDSA
jgi:hypothetical protein